MLKQTESKSKSIDLIRHSDYILLMKALDVLRPYCDTDKTIEIIGNGITIPMSSCMLFTSILESVGTALSMLKPVNILLFISMDQGIFTINIHGGSMTGMGIGKLEWNPDYYQ